ncbi:hypothetical protein ACFOD4_18525 [Pseudoroseomonas globiformis]|uniref:Glycine zipper 2TM domain-containing protein n=1 Tax=Teichococcus globiformis TaxID=2307229 RepID=A0ABV7G2Y8_9PROT
MTALARPAPLSLLLALSLAALAACSPSYSPDAYSGRAVQQANKVEAGIVVGRRQVEILADGSAGGVAGAAAGSVAGTRVGGGDITSAFAGIGGGLVGGLLGTAAEKGVGSTQGYEYIVRKPNGDLVSVTQRDETPLAIGQKVLVIAGTQARIVADYTVPNLAEPAPAPVPAPGTGTVTVPHAAPGPDEVARPIAPAPEPLPASIPQAVPHALPGLLPPGLPVDSLPGAAAPPPAAGPTSSQEGHPSARSDMPSNANDAAAPESAPPTTRLTDAEAGGTSAGRSLIP